MSENETAPKAEAALPPATDPKPAPPKKPARVLPTAEDIARWVEGEDLPSLENLFNLLNTKLFDAKVMQIKKEELLPQHWQVISRLEPPPDEEFYALPVVQRLRDQAADKETGDERVEALHVAWQELRGKHPSLWNASDVFAAMRRIVDKKRDVSFHALLSAVRDVWRGSDLPQGREQLEVLWACLDFIRSKTKK
jgi:hypothetical protein